MSNPARKKPIALVDAQVIDQPSRAIAISPTPADLLRHAMDTGADLEKLEKLMDLQQRWEAAEARKAFVSAMAKFKAEPIQIEKDTHVNYQSSKGQVSYWHASIGNVTALICAALAKHGFAHRWDTNQRGGAITVTCIITHEQGHSEVNELTAHADDSGGKNGIQAIASTVTYLQRYTLLAITGMATRDQDDTDGRAPPERKEAPQDGQRDERQESLVADLMAVADDGWGALSVAWQALPEQSRKVVGPRFGEIKKHAEWVDKANKGKAHA